MPLCTPEVVPFSLPQLQECLCAVGAFIEKRRPNPEIRDRLDYRADISGSEVVIVSLRPSFDDTTTTIEMPLARAKWVATRKTWRLYWMRADNKWHSYRPLPEAPTLAAILAEVDRDPICCFFG